MTSSRKSTAPPKPHAHGRRPKNDRKGDVLVAAMQASPHRDVDIAPKGASMPVSEVDL